MACTFEGFTAYARLSAADLEEKQIPLEKKAVSTAIDEVYTGKLSINK